MTYDLQIIATGLGSEPAEPAEPAAPIRVEPFAVTGTVRGVVDFSHLQSLADGVILAETPTHITLQSPFAELDVSGTGFTYDLFGDPVGGTMTGFTYFDPSGGFNLSLQFAAGVSIATLENLLANGFSGNSLSDLFPGAEWMQGAFNAADTIHGGSGNDLLEGSGGADQLWGGQGNDLIYAGWPGVAELGQAASSYLRGEEGNDYIVGNFGFDDINGNQGNDTAMGGEGDDWVVGGKDDDLLFGDTGGDIVYGNLGNDTCEGGADNDLIRGGQGNDVLFGDAGADWLSGDRGNDTMSGGGGADIFHTFSGAGIDRVTDFNLAEGDRVQLDPGTTWTVGQVGADTVIDMGNGDQMILVGVQASSLTGSWIFGA